MAISLDLDLYSDESPFLFVNCLWYMVVTLVVEACVCQKIKLHFPLYRARNKTKAVCSQTIVRYDLEIIFSCRAFRTKLSYLEYEPVALLKVYIYRWRLEKNNSARTR